MPVIPEEVRTLYDKHRRKETRLGCAGYLDLLQPISKGCSEVYIIIDALDECINENGESIWSDLLTKLKLSVPNLRLLCTSRHINDIGGSLAGATQIEVDRLVGFCRDDATLRDEILKVAALKAEGM